MIKQSTPKLFLVGLILTFGFQGAAQDARPPNIDMHLHAFDLDFLGGGLAQPEQDADDTFGPVFDRQKMGILAASSTEDLQQKTIAAMDQFNIDYGVVSGELAEGYQRDSLSRLLASPAIDGVEEPVDLRVRDPCGGFDPKREGIAE